MKRPNFFILGAPKCGTTSLAAWLAEHPEIFFSAMKEPHFFNVDGYPMTRSQRHYERLFAAADGYPAVGEASTGYLSSTAAVPRILEYAPDARFVVCLRNPVTMAVSLHEQRVYEEKEHISDFSAAWKRQDERRQGRGVNRWGWEPKSLVYGDLCALGSQMERLYEKTGRKRVLPLLLDDMQQDPGAAYRQVLAHLGVADDGRSEFPVHNAAKERRSGMLTKFVRLGAAAKRRAGIAGGLGLLNKIDGRNTVYRPRPEIDAAMRTELQRYFAPEIDKLAAVLGRDLSHWSASVERPLQ